MLEEIKSMSDVYGRQGKVNRFFMIIYEGKEIIIYNLDLVSNFLHETKFYFKHNFHKILPNKYYCKKK